MKALPVLPLPEPHPDLKALDLLVCVGELGSISAAALAHGISQPAASMRLRQLERVLGIKLLDRQRTGASLTSGGRAVAEWASVVLQDVRALLAGTAALRGRQHPQLRLAASLTVAEYLLPRWLQELTALSPRTTVSLQVANSETVVQMLRHGRAQLGFIEGPRPPRELRSKELFVDELVVVVAKGHPWARRRRPLSPQELASTPLVLREPGSGTREVLAEALAEHGCGLRASIELGSTTAIKAAVVGGTGPAVLSALAVRNELSTGNLVTVACSDLHLKRTVRAIWASQHALPEVATRLLANVARL